jgi:hypothetical protein
MLHASEKSMTDDRRKGAGSPTSNEVRIVSSVRLSDVAINAAGSSPQNQTVLVIQDERARQRSVDQGDD